MASSLEVLALAKLSFYDNKPGFYAYQGSVQSIPNTAFTNITFDTVSIDNWSGWSAGDTTKYTVQVAGKYLITGTVYYAANATGARFARISKTGTVINGSLGEVSLGSASNAGTVTTSTVIVQAAIGDYFQIGFYQSSGAALSTNAGLPNVSSFTVEFMSL